MGWQGGALLSYRWKFQSTTRPFPRMAPHISAFPKLHPFPGFSTGGVFSVAEGVTAAVSEMGAPGQRAFVPGGWSLASAGCNSLLSPPQIKMLSDRKRELELRLSATLQENDLLQGTVEELQDRVLVLERQGHDKDLQVLRGRTEAALSCPAGRRGWEAAPPPPPGRPCVPSPPGLVVVLASLRGLGWLCSEEMHRHPQGMLPFCAEPLAPEQCHRVLSGPRSGLGPSKWECRSASGWRPGLSEGAWVLAHALCCCSPGPVDAVGRNQEAAHRTQQDLHPAPCFCQLWEKARLTPW